MGINDMADFCSNMSEAFTQLTQMYEFFNQKQLGNKEDDLFDRLQLLYRLLLTLRVRQKAALDILNRMQAYQINHLPDCDISAGASDKCTCGLTDLKKLIDKLNLSIYGPKNGE